MNDFLDPRFPKKDVAIEGTTQTVIPVIEEVAIIGSKIVETGKVIISKEVIEQQEELYLKGSREECEVERVTLNTIVESAPPVRYEGETMIIPVLQEVAVVEKKIMLVEEIRVTRRQVQTEETIPVTLRKETVSVTREAIKEGQTPPPTL